MNPGNDRQSYTVSVVIPAYNVEKYIGRAIDSVLAQTRRPDEIIIVDDGSTDSTAEVIKSYGSKVRFIRQENGGASVARNTGIEAATGQWIAFLDADDEWLPEKLQLQIEHLMRNPDLVWSATNYEIRPMDGMPPKLAFEPGRSGFLCTGAERLESYLDAVATGLALSTITIMVRRSVIIDVGMFRVGQWWAQDTDLFFRIAYKWPRIGYLQNALSVNHFGRPESITQTNKLRIEQRCDLIERHLKMAAEHGMSESFRPCALKLLTRWLRGYVDLPNVEISQILDRFGDILPRNLKIEMRMRIVSPRLAGCFFRYYFAVKDFLRSKQR